MEDRIVDLEPRLAAAQRQLDTITELLGGGQRLARLGSWRCDLLSGRVAWSEEMFALFGCAPGQIEPSLNAIRDHTHPDDQARLRKRIQATMAGDGPFDELVRMARAGGDWLARARAELSTDAWGRAVAMLGTFQDVTEPTTRSRADEAQLARAVRYASDAIYAVNPDGQITSWNPAAERLFGYSADEIVGRASDILLVAPAGPDRAGPGATRRAAASFEGRGRRKNGELIDIAALTSPLRDATGRDLGAVIFLRDITERLRTEARIERLASHDALTGLFNRHRFEEELAAASARAERDGGEAAVLVVDLDNFKHINQRFGRNAGDALVCAVATALRETLQEGDVIARVGGDELAVLRAPASGEDVAALADRLLATVRATRMTAASGTVTTSASVGVAIFGGRATPAEQLLADADRALQESKDAGRDRFTVHAAEQRVHARARLRTDREQMIRDALARDRFELYCQPIVELTTGEMTQCEILLRLRSDGQIVLPGDILPTAERLGLVHAIDEWVIARAVAAAAAHPGVTFCLNLSGSTIDNTHLAAFIGRQLEETGARPDKIVIELSESAAVSNMARARALARAVSRLGCGFALDDFGAGFSTFYYLKLFPADYLKIDGEFVADPRSRTDELVIESIVRIARDVGKRTVAELVSDDATLQRMQELGVDLAQGFHISYPFPLSHLIDAPRRPLERADTRFRPRGGA